MTERRRTKRSEVRAAREMRAAGVPYRLIQIRLNRSKAWVQAHAQDVPGAVTRGVEPPAETREAAIRMCRGGMRHREIADRLEIKYYWVAMWCRGLRPEIPRPVRAIEMRSEGATLAEIADKLEYKNARTVSAVMAQHRRRQKMVEAAE